MGVCRAQADSEARRELPHRVVLPQVHQCDQGTLTRACGVRHDKEPRNPRAEELRTSDIPLNNSKASPLMPPGHHPISGNTQQAHCAIGHKAGAGRQSRLVAALYDLRSWFHNSARV
jgi:hypothetical protein